MSSSMYSTTIDNSIIRAHQQGYDNTLYVIRYLLDQCNDAKFEDERIEIATKMFKFINKNPNILIYEPTFCTIVNQKINEFTNQITKNTESYNKAEYNKAIKMMKFSIHSNIHNSYTRSNIYKHLDEINSILYNYNSLSYYNELLIEMNKVRNTIQQNNKEIY
jgi:hypothetical protein